VLHGAYEVFIIKKNNSYFFLVLKYSL